MYLVPGRAQTARAPDARAPRLTSPGTGQPTDVEVGYPAEDRFVALAVFRDNHIRALWRGLHMALASATVALPPTKVMAEVMTSLSVRP